MEQKRTLRNKLSYCWHVVLPADRAAPVVFKEGGNSAVRSSAAIIIAIKLNSYAIKAKQ
jgi:hypothetical protein